MRCRFCWPLIDPWEVVMIAAVVLILLIWGPQKLPELAKSLGQAKHELERVGKGENENRQKQ